MTYSIGDKVRLRLVKENHKNSLKNCGMIVSGVITKAYPEHRWYQAEFQIGKQRETCAKLQEETSIQNRKSEFIGCQNCGSSLRREKLRGEKCPVCGADLRSKTSLERIAKAHEKLIDIENALLKKQKELERKGKPTIKWLVKIEYHT